MNHGKGLFREASREEKLRSAQDLIKARIAKEKADAALDNLYAETDTLRMTFERLKQKIKKEKEDILEEKILSRQYIESKLPIYFWKRGIKKSTAIKIANDQIEQARKQRDSNILIGSNPEENEIIRQGILAENETRIASRAAEAARRELYIADRHNTNAQKSVAEKEREAERAEQEKARLVQQEKREAEAIKLAETMRAKQKREKAEFRRKNAVKAPMVRDRVTGPAFVEGHRMYFYN
jgi:hypothetical protein